MLLYKYCSVATEIFERNLLQNVIYQADPTSFYDP